MKEEAEQINIRMGGKGKDRFKAMDYALEYKVSESTAMNNLNRLRIAGYVKMYDFGSYVLFSISLKKKEKIENLKENLNAFTIQKNYFNKLIKQTKVLLDAPDNT